MCVRARDLPRKMAYPPRVRRPGQGSTAAHLSLIDGNSIELRNMGGNMKPVEVTPEATFQAYAGRPMNENDRLRVAKELLKPMCRLVLKEASPVEPLYRLACLPENRKS